MWKNSAVQDQTLHFQSQEFHRARKQARKRGGHQSLDVYLVVERTTQVLCFQLFSCEVFAVTRNTRRRKNKPIGSKVRELREMHQWNKQLQGISAVRFSTTVVRGSGYLISIVLDTVEPKMLLEGIFVVIFSCEENRANKTSFIWERRNKHLSICGNTSTRHLCFKCAI